MNSFIWCKSFLSIYNLIPSITKAVDNLILIKGVNSSATSFATSGETAKQAESILTLSQRKINLINLKLLTDEILLEMDPFNSKVIVLKFIDNLLVDDITKCLNLTRRTLYRKLSRAIEEFERLFNKKVLSNYRIYKSFSEEKFLEDIFEKIDIFSSKTKDNSIRKQAETICNFIVNRMKRALLN